MKRHILIFTAIFGITLGNLLHAIVMMPANMVSKPWTEQTNKAYKLPSNDKEKLNKLFESGRIMILKDDPKKPSNTLALNKWAEQIMSSPPYVDAEKSFYKTVKELDKQIDEVKLSVRGYLSGLSWKERLEQLKESLFSILFELDPNTTVPLTRNVAQEFTLYINDLIGKIDQKIAGK